jgi:hypothetical protein
LPEPDDRLIASAGALQLFKRFTDQLSLHLVGLDAPGEQPQSGLLLIRQGKLFD